MSVLAPGTKLRTKEGAIIVIESLLGEGGQGRVYKVKYGNQSKALKVYIPEKVRNLKWFHNNLSEEIEHGCPTAKFVWPEALTEWIVNDQPTGRFDFSKDLVEKNGTFGYIMALRPSDYSEFTDILLAKKEFVSFTSMVNCAIRMVSAFSVLHNKGRCYQDLNDGNFFIRTTDGDVLVCDNDNASPVKNPSGIAGKARYMAPSVVMGGKPNYNTDRYSLAVVLFLLFIRTHPLEGVRTLTVPEMNDYFLQLCYGKDPVFIGDPIDKRNGPNDQIEGVRNFFKRWPILTDDMKKIFIKAFSKEAMLNDERKYPSEKDWQRELLKFRTSFVKCPKCGREIIYDTQKPMCKFCHNEYSTYGYLSVGRYSIPIIKDCGIFQEHIDDFQIAPEQFDPLRISVIRVNSSRNVAAIENRSQKKWKVNDPSYASNMIKPGELLLLKNGLTFDIDGENVKVIMK